MPSLLSAADHVVWTERIRKENHVNGTAKGEFSVRNAVSVEDVPAKFKPGHMDPRDASRGGEAFDPKTLGWKAGDPLATEFRRCLNRQRAGPRERHQFPETRGQEIGWCQGTSGRLPERSAPSGSNPSKLGVGWLQKDGHGGPLTKMAAAKASGDAPLPAFPEELAKPSFFRKSKDGNPREELGVPPYAMDACGAQERLEAMRRAQADRDGASVSSRKGPSRSASVPAILKPPVVMTAAELNSRLGSQEEVVAKAMQHARTFMNKHSKSHSRYHGLAQSDVATFANAYTACWGTCMFHKKG